ncbi:hypothetical protein GALL_498310 [mine drainage metagenome]|uniref:Uncharacterized protein n=1 Tax=mine drainage metagenome TaxID=410659 RepID=A0A1J5PB94_9ZZZZ
MQQREFRALGEDFAVVQAAGIGGGERDSQNETEVAHAVDDERLHIGKHRSRPGVPETDQQIRHQAHRLPAEKELKHVVAHHQHQHGEGEQGDVAEKPLIAVVVGHIADGVDVHRERHEADDHHHQRGQPVDQEADLHVQLAHHHPLVNGGIEVGAIQHVIQHHQRECEGQTHPQDGEPVRRATADGAAEQADDDGCEQRRQRDGEQQGGVQRGLHGLSP